MRRGDRLTLEIRQAVLEGHQAGQAENVEHGQREQGQDDQYQVARALDRAAKGQRAFGLGPAPGPKQGAHGQYQHAAEQGMGQRFQQGDGPRPRSGIDQRCQRPDQPPGHANETGTCTAAQRHQTDPDGNAPVTQQTPQHAGGPAQPHAQIGHRGRQNDDLTRAHGVDCPGVAGLDGARRDEGLSVGHAAGRHGFGTMIGMVGTLVGTISGASVAWIT